MPSVSFQEPTCPVRVDTNLLRAVYRLGHVRDHPVPPPADLVPERGEAAQPTQPDRSLTHHTVNFFFTAIWFVTDPGGFYWPVFPLVGWGIGLAFNVWDVYSPAPTEEKIEREIQRLTRR